MEKMCWVTGFLFIHVFYKTKITGYITSWVILPLTFYGQLFSDTLSYRDDLKWVMF